MHNAPKSSFFRRRRIIIIAGVAALIGGGWILSTLSDSKPAKPKPRDFSMVQVALPPPPPPPPPPREEPKPREDTPMETNEMVVPDPVAADQPDAPVDEPASEGSEAMGTNVQGDGPPDGFGLVGRGSGGTIGGGRVGGGGSGNASWDNYSSQVGIQLRNALSQHEKTRAASLRLPISIWLDPNGTIERVRLDTSSGNPELDRAIETEVFADFRLASPPPTDMPQPIRLRITAQRPN